MSYDYIIRGPEDKREVRPDRFWQREQQLIRQRALLEKLRYKWHYQNAVDISWRLMQRLGDVGRRLFPLIGRGGWSGFGGGRLGD